MWHEDRCGNVYLSDQHEGSRIRPLTRGFQEVEALDGLLIATQYDLPWREGLFQGWDIYDISQCTEFRRISSSSANGRNCLTAMREKSRKKSSVWMGKDIHAFVV